MGKLATLCPPAEWTVCLCKLLLCSLASEVTGVWFVPATVMSQTKEATTWQVLWLQGDCPWSWTPVLAFNPLLPVCHLTTWNNHTCIQLGLQIMIIFITDYSASYLLIIIIIIIIIMVYLLMYSLLFIKYWKTVKNAHQSPMWPLQMSYFVRPTALKPEIFNLLHCKIKESSKFLHLRTGNSSILAIFAWKIVNFLFIGLSTNHLSPN